MLAIKRSICVFLAVVVTFAAGRTVLAQSAGTVDPVQGPWTGYMQCVLTASAADYQEEQTHTWRIVPGDQLPFDQWPAVWSVQGKGTRQVPLNTGTVMTETWTIDVPQKIAPLRISRRPASTQIEIYSQHGLLVGQDAINVVSSAGQRSVYSLQEWGFPRIDGPMANPTISGTRTQKLATGNGWRKPATVWTVETCTWNFTRDNPAATSSLAPVSQPPATATTAPRAGQPPASANAGSANATAPQMTAISVPGVLTLPTFTPGTNTSGATTPGTTTTTTGTPGETLRIEGPLTGSGALATGPPTNVRIEPQNPGLQKLTWNDPGAGQFRVLRRRPNASTWDLVSDLITGTQYLDRAIVPPGTVYRVEAVHRAGMSAGTEVVHQNPLPPQFPRQFYGAQDSSGKVTVHWTAVAQASGHRIFGPGFPPEGKLFDVRPDSTPNGGYTIAYEMGNVPPGVHTFSITAEYGAAGHVVDGMPSLTLTATARRARYRISITGFRAKQATNDDPILHRDGKGDEIFVAAFVGSDLGGVTRLDRKIVRSKVYGDVNGRPDRIQAGSSSPSGGIGPYNAVPATAGSVMAPLSPTADRLPLLVWEGELWDGDRGLAIVPTVWEWDGDDKNYQSWSGWLMGTRYDWWEALVKDVNLGPVKQVGIGPNLGADYLGITMDDSFGKDLAIGYSNVGMISLTEAARPWFSSRAFLIHRGSLERSLGDRPSTVLSMSFTGLGGVGGSYDVYLQVDRLP